MAYQTLYRTYRPQTFSEMVGQENIVRALSNQVSTKRIAHAYLFCGSRGTGKTSAARIMAMAINCQNPKNGDPCLECDNCKALKSETTLDVFEMDAASNSRVEEIREMLSRTDYPPQFVPYKVYIIDEVHMLSNAAFNALLKTLEEPPAYMVFILATTEPQKLPATILSRCQRYDFGRIPENDIIRKLKVALKDNVEAEEEALRLIAASAQGAMRDAWSLMDMCLGSNSSLTEENVRHALGAVSQDFLFDFLDALIDDDTPRALGLIEQLMKDGRDVTVFLREFNAHIRQVLAVLWTGKGSKDMSKEQLERLKAQAQSTDGQTLLFFLENCMRSEQDARWSTSQRAVLELLALRSANSHQEQTVSVRPSKPRLAAKPVERAESKPEPVKELPKEAVKETASEPVRMPFSGKVDEQAVTPLEPAIKEAPKPAPAQTEDDIPVFFEEPLPFANEEKPAVKEAKKEEPAKEEPLKEASGQALAKSPKDAWNNLLKRLKNEHPSLYSYVYQGKYGGYENKVFTLLMGEQDRVFISMLNEAERADPIAAILSEEMGMAVKFEAVNKDDRATSGKANEVETQIEELARVFGRDKIVLKND